MDLLQQDTLTKELAKIGKALSNPLRWTILSLIAQCEKPVQRIAEQAGHPVANISIQLRILLEAGLVVSRKEGRQVLYFLASDQVRAMLLSVQETASRVHPGARMVVQEKFVDENDILDEEYEDLVEQINSGRVLLVDLRPADDYEFEHITGAENIGLHEIESKAAEIKARNVPVVVYCRGPFCITSINGIKLLREHGIRTRRLPISVYEWRQRGFSVTRAARV
ncbi:metalloregulator ArsR/SmtB family transcription factor [Microvenator marinus]|uniref:Metalloregulator ArsR/SmtB family transcription factor n=1 Tax=Microvenator marinus TaxID=2600177 RepID=A0A5B8XSL0_9DELT|nr:metalloregulator ArsR/SmtB family transcription factor [Microvenator marinus]QED28505.1 metalloregulator ArsR/SmtB family transcription factor [Microvenator marinus]